MALGSFRRSTAIPRTPDPGRRTILVIPVGWIEDSTRLFNAAASLAVELDDHNFLLRCHPVLPFDEVRPYLDWDPEEVGNIEVSTKLSQNEVKEDWEGAVNYVEQYFPPVSESSVDTLVGYIESSGSDSPGTRHTHG